MNTIESKTALKPLSCYVVINPEGMHVATLHVWFSANTTALRADLYHTIHSAHEGPKYPPEQFYVRGGGMSALLAKMVIDGVQLYDHGDCRWDNPVNTSLLEYLNSVIAEHGVSSTIARETVRQLETRYGVFPRNAHVNNGVTEGYGSLHYFPEFRRLEVMEYKVICAFQYNSRD